MMTLDTPEVTTNKLLFIEAYGSNSENQDRFVLAPDAEIANQLLRDELENPSDLEIIRTRLILDNVQGSRFSTKPGESDRPRVLSWSELTILFGEGA